MSFFKYYKERNDADGEPLWWPGGPDGFPFRGKQPPQTTEREFEDLRLSGKFKCRTFYLSKDEDLKTYQQIRDKCANGLFFPIDRDRQWDEENKNYRIYLEWIEPAYEMPPTIGANNDAVRAYVQKDDSALLVPYRKLSGLQQGW